MVTSFSICHDWLRILKLPRPTPRASMHLPAVFFSSWIAFLLSRYQRLSSSADNASLRCRCHYGTYRTPLSPWPHRSIRTMDEARLETWEDIRGRKKNGKNRRAGMPRIGMAAKKQRLRKRTVSSENWNSFIIFDKISKIRKPPVANPFSSNAYCLRRYWTRNGPYLHRLPTAIEQVSKTSSYPPFLKHATFSNWVFGCCSLRPKNSAGVFVSAY